MIAYPMSKFGFAILVIAASIVFIIAVDAGSEAAMNGDEYATVYQQSVDVVDESLSGWSPPMRSVASPMIMIVFGAMRLGLSVGYAYPYASQYLIWSSVATGAYVGLVWLIHRI